MISGSLVALVTPMFEDGSIDFESLQKLVDWHVAEGTNAIVSVGTTGESATLDFDDHMQVIRKTVEFADGRIPVIAGTGANSTSEAIFLTRGANEAGATACLLVTPYYNKPPQEGLYRHYKKVAADTKAPIILYNVPGRTGCDLLPDTVLRLSEIDNIIGLKEAVGDHSRVQTLLSMDLPEKFALYSGDDATARTSILAGFNGDISVTANVAPGLMARMCSAALAGNAELAAEIDDQLADLHNTLFLDPNPIPVKWALKEMKKIGEGIRLPLVPMSQTHEEPIREALRRAGAVK